MAGVAPPVTKLVQDTAKALPVAVFGRAIFLRPGIEFGNQGQALVAVLSGIGLELFEPSLHHFVGLVACLVKALPHGVVGYTTLVRLLPLLAHSAQGLLHLASADGLTFRALEQAFGLDQKFFAQLVSAPALPSLELPGGGEGGLRLRFKRMVN